MDKRVIFAVAGSGKTTYIVDSLSRDKRSLIVTYTVGNYNNLCRKISEKFNGDWPENIWVMGYFTFLYRFCYKPFLADRLKTRGIFYEKNPNNRLRQSDKAYYITSTGYIYILKSKSTDPRIQSYDHLYKIGFATTTVEKRIANAKKEPTYLMADVEVIAEYQAFNINPQKFEYYLHAFFGESCLDLLVADKDGKNHQPKEWFIAPLQVIQQAVELLVNGQIMSYQYNKFKKEIELR